MNSPVRKRRRAVAEEKEKKFMSRRGISRELRAAL